MQLKRKLVMVGATFFLAAATGHLMQNGTGLIGGSAPGVQLDAEKLAAEKLAGQKLAAQQLAAQQLAATDMMPDQIVPLAGSATGGLGPLTIAPAPTAPTMLKLAPETPLAAAPAPLDCTPTLALTRAPAAMMDLALAAPCNLNARVVIKHAGLTVTGVTDAAGQLKTSLPAMASAAHVTIALPGGVQATADLAVPALADYDRVAVQWQGDDAFQLHAFEFGADYGDAGHVSAATPRTSGYAVQASGGFLTALGNGAVLLPMLAEVYTFPTGHSLRSGVVRLTIEAEVTPATCGHDMLGETLEAHAGAPVKIVALTLAMPGCDAAGDYVILNNLLPDVKIARN